MRRRREWEKCIFFSLSHHHPIWSVCWAAVVVKASRQVVWIFCVLTCSSSKLHQYWWYVCVCGWWWCWILYIVSCSKLDFDPPCVHISFMQFYHHGNSRNVLLPVRVLRTLMCVCVSDSTTLNFSLVLHSIRQASWFFSAWCNSVSLLTFFLD